MEGFAELVTDFMSPNMIRLAGNELGIDAFRDNPQVWSEKNLNFAFREIFEKLIVPESFTRRKPFRDPTLKFVQVYTGTKISNSYNIKVFEAITQTTPFWNSDRYGRIELTYSTLTQYFGDDFYEIQPALYYREETIRSSYGSRDLTLQHLVTSEFKHKIQHLYDKFYTVLSENYGNNEVIKAEFHVEGALGLGEGSRIDRTSTLDDVKSKFNDILTGHSLEFVMEKQGGVIVNEHEFREFVFSLTFYLVMFNAFAIIGDDVSGYKLFATQRKIYNNDYITGLYPQNLPASTSLSQAGELIYNTMQAQWNEENGETVWNFEDCWPIYLLDDARDLINILKLGFGLKLKVKPLEG
ncbi:hypothetical protein LCGC14_1316630 [marine sediment metagenome]|uniref:Uncharacterized protein n=1 Tax=marine sediment metagenome TaxID=412755 RepID=A0A0F9L641_9ZZZZ